MSFLITITKAMIAHEICGKMCMMAEMNQDTSYKGDDKFVFIKNWNDGKPLLASWNIILEGFHCYSGGKPEDTKIPSFISKDWNKSLRMFKMLKGL